MIRLLLSSIFLFGCGACMQKSGTVVGMWFGATELPEQLLFPELRGEDFRQLNIYQGIYVMPEGRIEQRENRVASIECERILRLIILSINELRGHSKDLDSSDATMGFRIEILGNGGIDEVFYLQRFSSANGHYDIPIVRNGEVFILNREADRHLFGLYSSINSRANYEDSCGDHL